MSILDVLNPVAWVAKIGGSVFGSIAGRFMQSYDAKTDAERQIILAQLDRQHADNVLRAQLAPAFKGLVYIAALPFIIHAWAVVFLASVVWPLFGGRLGIPALPKPFDEWEGQIILSFFILQPVSTVASAGKTLAMGLLAKWSRPSSTR